MNTFTGVDANVPNSRQLTTDGGQEGRNQNWNWVLRLGLSHPVRLARRSGNWFRNPCQPQEILEVCCWLIPCTDHSVVLTEIHQAGAFSSTACSPQPQEILEVCCWLIPCTDHSVVLTEIHQAGAFSSTACSPQPPSDRATWTKD